MLLTSPVGDHDVMPDRCIYLYGKVELDSTDKTTTTGIRLKNIIMVFFLN